MDIWKLTNLLIVSGSGVEGCGGAHWTDELQVWMNSSGISQERGGASEKNSEINVCSVVG
jgi:hypothetical protein